MESIAIQLSLAPTSVESLTCSVAVQIYNGQDKVPGAVKYDRNGHTGDEKPTSRVSACQNNPCITIRDPPVSSMSA